MCGVDRSTNYCAGCVENDGIVVAKYDKNCDTHCFPCGCKFSKQWILEDNVTPPLGFIENSIGDGSWVTFEVCSEAENVGADVAVAGSCGVDTSTNYCAGCVRIDGKVQVRYDKNCPCATTVTTSTTLPCFPCGCKIKQKWLIKDEVTRPLIPIENSIGDGSWFTFDECFKAERIWAEMAVGGMCGVDPFTNFCAGCVENEGKVTAQYDKNCSVATTLTTSTTMPCFPCGCRKVQQWLDTDAVPPPIIPIENPSGDGSWLTFEECFKAENIGAEEAVGGQCGVDASANYCAGCVENEGKVEAVYDRNCPDPTTTTVTTSTTMNCFPCGCKITQKWLNEDAILPPLIPIENPTGDGSWVTFDECFRAESSWAGLAVGGMCGVDPSTNFCAGCVENDGKVLAKYDENCPVTHCFPCGCEAVQQWLVKDEVPPPLIPIENSIGDGSWLTFDKCFKAENIGAGLTVGGKCGVDPSTNFCAGCVENDGKVEAKYDKNCPGPTTTTVTTSTTIPCFPCGCKKLQLFLNEDAIPPPLIPIENPIGDGSWVTYLECFKAENIGAEVAVGGMCGVDRSTNYCAGCVENDGKLQAQYHKHCPGATFVTPGSCGGNFTSLTDAIDCTITGTTNTRTWDVEFDLIASNATVENDSVTVHTSGTTNATMIMSSFTLEFDSTKWANASDNISVTGEFEFNATNETVEDFPNRTFAGYLATFATEKTNGRTNDSGNLTNWTITVETSTTTTTTTTSTTSTCVEPTTATGDFTLVDGFGFTRLWRLTCPTGSRPNPATGNIAYCSDSGDVLPHVTCEVDPGCDGSDTVPIGGSAIGTTCDAVMAEGATCNAVCAGGLASNFGSFVCIGGQMRHTSYCPEQSTVVLTSLAEKIAASVLLVLGRELVEATFRKSLAVALAVPEQNVQSVRWTVAAASTGRRVLAAYTVSYEVILRGTDSIWDVMRRASTVIDRGSDANRAFTRSMLSGGLEIIAMEYVVSPQSFEQLVVRTFSGAIIPMPSMTDYFDFNSSNWTLEDNTVETTTSTSTKTTVQDDSERAHAVLTTNTTMARTRVTLGLTNTSFAVEEENDTETLTNGTDASHDTITITTSTSTTASSVTDEFDESTTLGLHVPCDSVPTDPNGMYTEADDSWPDGTWWLRCDQGYIPAGGQNMSRCLATGVLRLAGQCQLSSCNGKQAAADHAGVAGTTCWEEMLEGEKCELKCLEGWQARGFFVCAWSQLLGSPLCLDQARGVGAIAVDVAKVSGALDIYIEPLPLDDGRNDTALLMSGFATFLSIPLTDVAFVNVTTSRPGRRIAAGHNRRLSTFGLRASMLSVVYEVWVEDAPRAQQITSSLREIGYLNTYARSLFTLVLASKGYTVEDISATQLPWLSEDPRVRLYEEQSHADGLVQSGNSLRVFLSFALTVVWWCRTCAPTT